MWVKDLRAVPLVDLPPVWVWLAVGETETVNETMSLLLSVWEMLSREDKDGDGVPVRNGEGELGSEKVGMSGVGVGETLGLREIEAIRLVGDAPELREVSAERETEGVREPSEE